MFVSNTTMYVCIRMFLIHVQQAVVDVGVCARVANRSKELRQQTVHSLFWKDFGPKNFFRVIKKILGT